MHASACLARVKLPTFAILPRTKRESLNVGTLDLGGGFKGDKVHAGYSPRKFCLRKCKTVEPPRPRDTGDNNGPVGRSGARPGNRGRGKSLARRTRSNWSRCNGCIGPDRIDCRNCRRWSQVCTRLSAATSISRYLSTRSIARFSSVGESSICVQSVELTYLCNVDNTRRDRGLFSSRGNGGRGKLAWRRSAGHRCICK